jgi:hypothetical protein
MAVARRQCTVTEYQRMVETGILHEDVEVVDTALEYDRGVKLLRYAQAGIPEVWLVDLNADVIWVYSPSITESRLGWVAAYQG